MPAAVDAATLYAQRVVSGDVPAGALHRLACERHLRDLETGPARGLVWNPQAVADAQTFAGLCRHPLGALAGQPIVLQAWQLFLLGSVLGWTRASDGLRRFRTAFVELPRGNGKSVLAAILALKVTFLDAEEGAQGYTVATKRDQARIVFGYARKMVLRSPELRRHINANQLYRMTGLSMDASLEPLGADADTLDGLRPHLVIGDEVHKHPNANVIDVMQTGMGTQLQPLLFEITTAGSLSNRESVWWAHRAYSVQLLERVLEDDTWFALVVGADRDDDWTDEATWRKANPNYGVSVMADDLARKCDQAKAMPSYQNTFRRLHLGQLVEQDNRYVSMDQWTTPASVAPLDLERLKDRPCYGGLDLSTTTDLSAFVLVWLEEDGGFSVLPHFWVPEDGMDERARKDRVPYPAWARDGFLTATPGAVVDYGFIFETVKDLLGRFSVKGIAFDRWNASHLVTMLTDAGAPMMKFGQGYVSMNQPTKELARQLAAGTLRHGGHPVLTWNASNMTVATDPAGNVKPDKGRAADRIDGMVAMVMGMALAGTTPTVGAADLSVWG